MKRFKEKQALLALRRQQNLVGPPSSSKNRDSPMFGKFDKEGNYHVKPKVKESMPRPSLKDPALN